MIDHIAWEDKKVKPDAKEKSPAEKFLEDKKNAALGIAPSNQFGNKNPMANRSWFPWNSWWGKPAIRKHSARSR